MTNQQNQFSPIVIKINIYIQQKLNLNLFITATESFLDKHNSSNNPPMVIIIVNE